MEFFFAKEGTRKIDQQHIVLKPSNWEDDGYYTTFIMIYHSDKSSNQSYRRIGEIKILFKDERRSIDHMPPNFTQLSDEYLSVVQDIYFLEQLNRLGITDLVLKSLNEVAYKPQLALRKRKLQGVMKSLTRYSTPNARFQKSTSNLPNRNIDFSYSVKLRGIENRYNVAFAFSPEDLLGNRLHAIIGFNGVGKTRYLSSLAKALSGKTRSGKFLPSRPPFTSVIAVSLSIFDDFYKPASGNEFSYTYVGFTTLTNNGEVQKAEEVVKNRRQISKDLSLAWEEIGRRSRQEGATGIISRFLGDSAPANVNNKSVDDRNSIYESLSSGQKVIYYIIVNILARIETNSLILIDEIENHLHPTAISLMLKVINEILNTYDSYSILATHSALVLQEIPSSYITIFEKLGNQISFRKPDIQTFGEMIDVINDEIYRFPIENSNYKIQIKEAIKNTDSSTLSEYFSPRLAYHVKQLLDTDDSL